jgi:hypothetical protein
MPNDWNSIWRILNCRVPILSKVLADSMMESVSTPDSCSETVGFVTSSPTRISLRFASAAFLRPDKTQEVGFARCSISGLLLVKPGSPQILGVLHPNPARAFVPACLPAVEFGQVEN